MPHFVGLDVSQKVTALCVVNEQGSRLWRGICATDPEAISACILRHAGSDAKAGVETGSMRLGSFMACAALGWMLYVWTRGR
jgi:transposase